MLGWNPMKSPQTQRNSRTASLRRGSGISLATLVTLALGCASPGNPRPPSLNLPEIVTDLAAFRVGDQVELRWTTPTHSTDGIDLKGNLTAEICRQNNLASSTCSYTQRVAVVPGPSHAIDTLPATLTTEPSHAIAYHVQILNTAGRSAGHSAQVFAAAGAAPPPVQQLHAAPTRDGVVLSWQGQPTNALVELVRTLPNAPKPAAATPKPATTTPPAAIKSPLKLAAPNPVQIRLQTPGDQSDAGGTIDRTARKGETYAYTAQRIRTITLEGHALELRSSVSSPVTLLLNDTFPPQPPTGLAAVPSGSGAAIDLSWQANSETDLAGYHVYRQELSATNQPIGTSQRLSQTPVTGPAFHDSSAVAGHHYAYRVTAIDATGNESTPSAPISETATEP
jgi:hypothetical protein